MKRREERSVFKSECLYERRETLWGVLPFFFLLLGANGVELFSKRRAFLLVISRTRLSYC